MIYWGIDPGPSHCGVAYIRNGKPHGTIIPTSQLTDPYLPFPVNEINGEFYSPEKVRVGIEMPEGMGQIAGRDTLETAFVAGQIYICLSQIARVVRFGRKSIKSYVGVSHRKNPDGTKAKTSDSQVRRAMIERWGEVGTKKNPGPTYGIHKDAWAALAVATCVYDKEMTR